MTQSIEEAMANIAALCGSSAAGRMLPYLERAREWDHSDLLFTRLVSAPAIPRLNDYLAEMKFGIIFEDLGFETSIIPEAEGPTPDLNVARDSLLACVEVKHFRRVPPGDPEREKLYVNQSFFRRFGAPERDVMKSLLRIRDKYRQVRGSDPGIIALWNDDEGIEPAEVGAAVDALVRSDHGIPQNLLFVLFGTSFLAPASKQFLFCYPFGDNGANAYGRWMEELESLRSSGFRSC